LCICTHFSSIKAALNLLQVASKQKLSTYNFVSKNPLGPFSNNIQFNFYK
jgi:hypothetical protein